MKKILMLISIILIGCGSHNKYQFNTEAERHFYTDCCGMDYVRFPLLYPYEVMNGDFKEEKWIINLQRGFMFYPSIYKVTKVTVLNDIILVQKEYTENDITRETPLLFFVLIPSKQIEEGFPTEIEFRYYISTLGISEFKWWEVHDAFRKFKSTECLPWIPGCGNI